MPEFDEPAIVFLGLARLKGVGFKSLRELGGVDAIGQKFASGGSDFVQSVTRNSEANAAQRVLQLGEEAAEVLKKNGIELVTITQPRFPVQFAELDPNLRPLWFFYEGNHELLATEAIAVVGTRSPSNIGEFLTRYAVSAAQEAGATVVSGLAKGVDELAHEWALSSGVPNISVLGTGLLKAYPAKNAELARRIVADDGLLISEYMPDAAPSAETFVWRNRLQAALAKCVIAPEWKRSSGTAHTIKFAKRMSRPTINLRINGVFPSPEHGTADELFEVPREHSALMAALRKVDPHTEARISALQQQSLF
ncbi:DNA-processing protein DprA [Paraburkholderia sediminicola]|uniref:DNA-processing protein DprA n=1 Tax=Paraburkholderia sediminicola TaxID=458836 RepID=UPI0038BB9B49